jgi:hypothetical protein
MNPSTLPRPKSLLRLLCSPLTFGVLGQAERVYLPISGQSGFFREAMKTGFSLIPTSAIEYAAEAA